MSVLVYMGSSPSLFNMMKNFYSCIRMLLVGGWFLLSMFLLCQCKSKEATAVVNYSKGFDGIDVSHHNGVIDWKTVRKNNKNIPTSNGMATIIIHAPRSNFVVAAITSATSVRNAPNALMAALRCQCGPRVLCQ